MKLQKTLISEAYALQKLLQHYFAFQQCLLPSRALICYLQAYSRSPITRWQKDLERSQQLTTKPMENTIDLEREIAWCRMTREQLVDAWMNEIDICKLHLISGAAGLSRIQDKLKLLITEVTLYLMQISAANDEAAYSVAANHLRVALGRIKTQINGGDDHRDQQSYAGIIALAEDYYSLPVLQYLPQYRLASHFAKEFGVKGCELPLVRDVLGTCLIVADLQAFTVGIPWPWHSYLMMLLLPQHTSRRMRWLLSGLSFVMLLSWLSWRADPEFALSSSVPLHAGAYVFATGLQSALPIIISQLLPLFVSDNSALHTRMDFLNRWVIGLITYIAAMMFWYQSIAPGVSKWWQPLQQGECVGEPSYCLAELTGKYGFTSSAEAKAWCNTAVIQHHPDHATSSSSEEIFNDCILIRKLFRVLSS